MLLPKQKYGHNYRKVPEFEVTLKFELLLFIMPKFSDSMMDMYMFDIAFSWRVRALIIWKNKSVAEIGTIIQGKMLGK